MFDWLAKTWGYSTATEDIAPTEHPQSKYTAQTHQQSRTHASSRTLDDIVVEGSGQFVNHVNRCIEEVRGTKWESLVIELRKVTQVFNYADTGVSNREFKTDLASICCNAWQQDSIEGASILIHESVHTKREFSKEFDYSNYANEELIAFKPQIEFLRANGRHSYAAQLENSDGRHNTHYLSSEILAMQR